MEDEAGSVNFAGDACILDCGARDDAGVGDGAAKGFGRALAPGEDAAGDKENLAGFGASAGVVDTTGKTGAGEGVGSGVEGSLKTGLAGGLTPKLGGLGGGAGGLMTLISSALSPTFSQPFMPLYQYRQSGLISPLLNLARNSFKEAGPI